jgi:hypothetical protein
LAELTTVLSSDSTNATLPSNPNAPFQSLSSIGITNQLIEGIQANENEMKALFKTSLDEHKIAREHFNLWKVNHMDCSGRINRFIPGYY